MTQAPSVDGPHPYPGDSHVWHVACPICGKPWIHKDSADADAAKRAAAPVWEHMRQAHGVSKPVVTQGM